MVAVIVAALPLLHRVGPRAAIVFVIVSYPATFVVGLMLGTDSGIQMQYLSAAACAALILGIHPIAPPVAFSALALAFIFALEIFAPRDGGLLSEAAMLAREPAPWKIEPRRKKARRPVNGRRAFSTCRFSCYPARG